jgi:hypothetical protein
MHYFELSDHLLQTAIAARNNNRQAKASNVELDRQRDKVVHSCECEDQGITRSFNH